MKEFGIPNKIVIAGTSAMKLNDRFSNLPPPRKNVHRANKPVDALVSNKVYHPFANSHEIVQPVHYQEVSVPRRRFRATHRPQTYSTRVQNVPIESRLSIPVVVGRGKPVLRGRGVARGVGRAKGNVRNIRPMVTNETRPANRKRGGVTNKPGPPLVRRGVEKATRGKKPLNESFGPKKSVQQLDKELDDYMRKKKHAPIII